MSISVLSAELLALVFTLLDSDTPGPPFRSTTSWHSSQLHFSRVSRTFRAIADDPHNVARYLIRRYGRASALSHALRLSAKISPDLLRCLLAAGANLSRALVAETAIQRRNYSYSASDTWANRIPSDAYDALIAAARARFPEFDLPPSRYHGVDHDNFTRWQKHLLAFNRINVDLPFVLPNPLPVVPQAVLDQTWPAAQASFEVYSFLPWEYSATDKQLARSVCLDPKLFRLATANGWEWNDSVRDSVVRSVLFSRQHFVNHSIWPPTGGGLANSERSSVIADDLQKLLQAPESPIHISATVCCEALVSPPLSAVDMKLILEELEARAMLRFSIRDIAIDLLRLAHHSNSTVLRAGWLQSLFRDWLLDGTPPVQVCSVFFASLFQTLQFSIGVPVASVQPLPRAILELISHLSKTFGSTKVLEIVVDMLCDPFLRSVKWVLTLYVEVLDPKNADVHTVVERAATRMVRLPTKGATLLELVKAYPFLKPIVRGEILRHRIDFSRLPAPRDVFRPLYCPFPVFMSPLAFDFADAQRRYPSGLGPNPWVETCYAGPPRPAPDPLVSTSIWPIEPDEYEYVAGEGDEAYRVNLGRVSGVCHGMKEESRVPQFCIPVAIAMLDIFEPKDLALDIMLMHAILNLNPSITQFYLSEGVPLRAHHLRAPEALGFPRLQCIVEHLEKPPSPAAEVKSSKKKKHLKSKGKGKGEKKLQEMGNLDQRVKVNTL